MSSNGHVDRDPADSRDGRDDDRSTPPDPTQSDPAPLAHRVVEYPTGPDRCTVYPPESPDHVRMTTWISANHRSFVDLEEWR